MSYNIFIYNLKNLPKHSQLNNDLLNDSLNDGLKKGEAGYKDLKDGIDNIIPSTAKFNLLLEKQIAILQLVDSTSKGVVERFDILEQRAKGINQSFSLNADNSIRLAKSVDKVGASLKINTRSAKQYLGEINKLVPGLGKLDQNHAGYFKNLLTSNEILRERIGLSADEAIKIRQLSQLQNRELIPSIEGYVKAAAKMQDEGTTGAFQIFAEQISNTSADVLAQYSQMAPNAFFKTTVKAKQLGLTLNDIYRTSEQMLDIQKQTEGSYQFQLFTGKKLETQEYKNVAAAMNRATIEQDLETQLDIIGSLIKEHGEDIKTNPAAREAMADVLGMEASKLLEIYTRQQEINDLNEEGQSFKEDALLKEIETILSRDRISKKTALEESDVINKTKATFKAADIEKDAGDIIKSASDMINETEVGKMVVGALTVAGTLNFVGDTVKQLKSGLKASDPKPKAKGGPVAMSTPYLVGEQGPEIFSPSSAGTIIPNNQLASGGSKEIVDALKGMTFNVINKFDGDAILTSIELAAGNRLT